MSRSSWMRSGGQDDYRPDDPETPGSRAARVAAEVAPPVVGETVLAFRGSPWDEEWTVVEVGIRWPVEHAEPQVHPIRAERRGERVVMGYGHGPMQWHR